MGKERNSKIELLRCVCMFMIIYLHLIIHGVNGGIYGEKLPVTLTLSFTTIFCMVAVNVFVIISGYFGINIINDDGKIRVKKILKNYSIILFYSVIIGLICFITKKITLKEFLSCFVPIISSKWWFATCYIALVLISPFINISIEYYWKNKYLYVFLALILLYTCLFDAKPSTVTLGMASLGFSTILICYCIGRILYFLNINNNDFLSKKSYFYFLGYILCCFISFLGTVFLFIITKRNYWFRISTYSSPITILASIFFFLTFLNLRIKNSKFINYFANATFGIYLLHESPLLKDNLYRLVNASKYYYSQGVLFVYLLIATACVFLVCSLIDTLRS